MIKQKIRALKKSKYLLLIAISIVVVSCGGKQVEVPAQPATKVDSIAVATVISTMEQKYQGTIEGSVKVDTIQWKSNQNHYTGIHLFY